MPPNDTSPTPGTTPGAAMQTALTDEHITVLTDALRDDDEHYEDPPLAEAR